MVIDGFVLVYRVQLVVAHSLNFDKFKRGVTRSNVEEGPDFCKLGGHLSEQ
jgi:hypothetical protein